MARVVGIFGSSSEVDAVVEQLQLNGITQITTLAPSRDVQDITRQLSILNVPERQSAEYHTRLEDQRWLLFVQASDLDLPLVQRALRSGQAIDIDLLPESMT